MKAFAIKGTLTNKYGTYKMYYRSDSRCVVFNTAEDILFAKKFRERKEAEKTIESLNKKLKEDEQRFPNRGFDWKFDLVEVNITERQITN